MNGALVADSVDLAAIRRAIRGERKVVIAYRDLRGVEGEPRTIWPFALAFFERVRVVVAWCEERQAFRHFRTDGILALTPTETRYPRRRQALLGEWRESQGIPPQ